MKQLLHIYVFLIAGLISAQGNYGLRDRTDKTLWQDFTYDMGNVFKGTAYVYSRPLHWQGDDFLKLGGVAAGTLSLYTLDDNIQREFRSHKEDVPDILLDYGWYAGSPQNNYGFTGAVYLTGLFTRNEKLRRTGVLLISSATATGFLQQLTKSATGRARPDTGFGKNQFRPFGGNSGYRSFPSGHAVLTFTNAHVIAKQFKSWWVKAPIYGVGLIPGLSRIYEDKHWASDVFLSWAMSYFIVEAIDIYLDGKYSEKYNDTKSKKTSINLTFSGNSVGAIFTF
ncbi:phosphatase PAP2 family protein [Winogradskyella forsetii]|uniref:phosphatase PAP2 family protein n=1 Tax=Winogradskyella forsetii TaxID=2686077 RepID=UPI0015CE9F9F|nr:phosphatase PAP2 family protein [Winogradskyella forsetii]